VPTAAKTDAYKAELVQECPRGAVYEDKPLPADADIIGGSQSDTIGVKLFIDGNGNQAMVRTC